MELSEDIKMAIAFKEKSIVKNIISASIQDDLGSWEAAKCFLEEALNIDQEIAILNSLCDIENDIDLTVPAYCDISKVGIGYWAIGTPVTNSNVGCGVLTISKTNVPPPYGEFRINDFRTNDFTKVVE